MIFLSQSYSQSDVKYSISCEGKYYVALDRYGDLDPESIIYSDESCLIQYFESPMFKHITNSITSTYYIDASTIRTEKNDDGEEVLVCQITSDVGNKYGLVLCLEGKYITFIKPNDFIIQWTIKSIFKNH